MPEGDVLSGSGREDERRTASRREVPVTGLLRDCIVGITCFPEPLPRGGKRRSRPRFRRAKPPNRD